MNKAELVHKVSNDTKLTKSETEHVLNATLDCIRKEVKKGSEVRLVGFGTFLRSTRKARMGRNPQTGKEIKIPSTKVPRFRAGSDFKKFVK